MPTYYARKAGNINATDVWATTPSGTAGAQTFAAGDILVANSFAITVNVSTDLGNGTVTNDNRDGATTGGSFALQNGVTLTANVVAGLGAGTSCVTLGGSNSATLVGSITASANAHAVLHNSAGTLTVTGNITSVTSNGNGINFTGSTLVVTGNVTGPWGIFFNSTGTCTITGTVTGATSGAVESVGNRNTGALTVVGSAIGGSGPGVFNNSTGTVTVTRAVGGPNAGSTFGVFNGTTGGIVNVEEIEYGDLGASPTSGLIRLVNKTSNVAVFYRFGTTKKTLVDTASTSLLPAASDVRHGVTYNSGATTGTCRVPTAANVLQGVLVDATTGTAIMTPAGFWDYATANANTSGSMGERLKNAATVASVGQALSDALTP